MPEVICLLSSSPPRFSASPPPPPKLKQPATQPSTKTASATTYDLTSTPPSPNRAKSYGSHAATSGSMDRVSGSNNVIATSAALNSASESKLNERDYVFLDDDFSSDIDLDKEYSLHLSQVRERAKKRFAATSNTTTTKDAVSPIRASTNPASTKGIEKPVDKPASVVQKANPTVEKMKELVFLDDPFSSSIDLDKEYDLNLPAAKKRRITPEPSSRTETHGLPDTLSSGGWRNRALPGNFAGLGNYGLPDPFSSPVHTRNGKETRSYDTSPKVYKPDLPSLPKPSVNKLSGVQLSKRPEKRVLDSDPITFTSSPDFAQMERDRRKRREQKQKAAQTALSDIEEPAPKPAPSKISKALETLDSDSDGLPELPGIGTSSRALSRTTSDTSYLQRTTTSSTSFSRSKSLANPAPLSKVPKPKRGAKTPEEKAALAAEKLALKEAEAERKRLLREEKARDKLIAADLAKVNVLKTDKKKSTPEMIVLFPSELDAKLRSTTEGFLHKLEVETRSWAGAGTSLGEILGGGEVKNVVRWKRKVPALYNEKEDIWEPLPSVRIELEKHILVYLPATEFVELITADEGLDLDEHVQKLKTRFCGYKIIYLLEGLTSWQKKNENIRNRAFSSAVRAQIPSAPSTTTTSRKSKPSPKPTPQYLPDELIEDALLALQIRHAVLIHHTASLVESAEWISIFTQHISTIPYRLQKMNLDTAFCMESGQVRAGEDGRDTFVRMLCEMRGVTGAVGWGVEGEIRERGEEVGEGGIGGKGKGVKGLVEMFREQGKEALKDVRKGSMRDGAFTDRCVGKSISKRVYAVFMGGDPGSTDV